MLFKDNQYSILLEKCICQLQMPDCVCISNLYRISPLDSIWALSLDNDGDFRLPNRLCAHPTYKHCDLWCASDGRQFVGRPSLPGTRSLLRLTAQLGGNRRSDPTPRGRPVLLRQWHGGILRGIAEWRQRRRRSDVFSDLWQYRRALHLPSRHSGGLVHFPSQSPLSADLCRQQLLNQMMNCPSVVLFVISRTVIFDCTECTVL